MGFEQKAENKYAEITALYPERAFADVDVKIERLKKIENGELPTIKLNEEEKKELNVFENKLGESLEEIYDIKINDLTLYLEYFLTKKARRDSSDDEKKLPKFSNTLHLLINNQRHVY